jgi:hypothetical protein
MACKNDRYKSFIKNTLRCLFSELNSVPVNSVFKDVAQFSLVYLFLETIFQMNLGVELWVMGPVNFKGMWKNTS